jgi:hypothetical protein
MTQKKYRFSCPVELEVSRQKVAFVELHELLGCSLHCAVSASISMKFWVNSP